MIVRGDRLAESERVNRLSHAHATMWAWCLSSSRLWDDFGCARWNEALLLVAFFPRRHPVPRRAVVSFMRAVEEIALVATYKVDGATFAQVRAWAGVEPNRRKYHRAPLPPWSGHKCTAGACARSGARIATAWNQHPERENEDPAGEDGPFADHDEDETPAIVWCRAGSCAMPAAAGLVYCPVHAHDRQVLAGATR